MQGYVYALINPSLPEMVKVGKTERFPERRAQELSAATGVPTPFIVGFSVHVHDCDAAETFAHALLTQRGHRVADNREFFSASLTDVVRVLLECEKLFAIDEIGQQGSNTESSDHAFEASTEDLIASLIEEGDNFQLGSNGFFLDHHSAKARFESASNLGGALATWRLGELLVDRESPVHDFRRGIALLQKAIQQGAQAFLCYCSIGRAYFEAGQTANSELAYTKMLDDVELRTRLTSYRDLRENPTDFSVFDEANIVSRAGLCASTLSTYFRSLEYGNAPFVAATVLFEFIPLLRSLIVEIYSVHPQKPSPATPLDGIDRYERNFHREIYAFRNGIAQY